MKEREKVKKKIQKLNNRFRISMIKISRKIIKVRENDNEKRTTIIRIFLKK